MTGRLIGTPPLHVPRSSSRRPGTCHGRLRHLLSLGSLLVYAATGSRPFDGASPYLTGYQVMHEQPRLDGVPEPLRSIAERCLDKEATARPQLAELHDLLLALPESATVVPPPGGERPHPGTSVTVPESGRRPRRTRRLVIAVATALAVTGLGLTTLHWVSSGTTGTTAPAAPTRSASAAVALPAGWQPWRASLLTTKTGEPLDELESGCVAGGALVYCAGTGFTVTALDAASGLVAWRSGTSPETSRPVGVQDGRVFTYVKPDSTQTFVTRRLVALDAKTGSRLWAHPVSEDRNAVMFDGGILAMDENATKFVAYDPTGRELWTAPAKSSAGDACTPAVLDGAPYGLCIPADDPSKGGVGLLHLNPADGASKEIAQLPTGADPLGVSDERLVFAVPKLAEGSFGSGEDQPYTALEEVDPADGGRRIPLPGAARGTPTLFKGVIHFVRPNGTVTAVRASDGKQLWQRATEIENLSAPVLGEVQHPLLRQPVRSAAGCERAHRHGPLAHFGAPEPR
ncbi:PQQ-binding-like beta-propeller repeat protein [Streptomyces sp. L7]